MQSFHFLLPLSVFDVKVDIVMTPWFKNCLQHVEIGFVIEFIVSLMECPMLKFPFIRDNYHSEV